ncbi:hypothetical protein ACK6VY_13360 [Proteus mirabilis]|uniref:hypothetical protein n=1 Tax=Proteus mirabilis TaxID=584 RepID=UPI0039B6475C
MQIPNNLKSIFLSIKTINNESYKFNTGLKSAILSCYNTISSFIKPFFHKTSKPSEVKVHISNIENIKNDKNIKLNNDKVIKTPHPMKGDNVKFGDLSKVQTKVKSDEIKNLIINDIISDLEEKPTLEKEKILQFKDELHFHSKRILFSTDESSLNEIKNEFLESIIDSILNSDEKIKSEFGNIDAYKYILLDIINETVSRSFANGNYLVKKGEE